MSDDWKPDRGQSIDRLYAWVATEADGGEGVCAAWVPGLGNMPLVGADRARIESLRPQAEDVAASTGAVVRLIEFSTRRQIGAPIERRKKPPVP